MYIQELSRDELDKHFSYPVTSTYFDFTNNREMIAAAFEDFALWEICKYSICDATLKTDIDHVRDFAVISHYYSDAIALIQKFQRAFRHIRPTTVVVEQGLQYDMRVAVEVARRFDIQTVAIENSFLKSYFFMDDSSGAITNRHALARSVWDKIKARHLTDLKRGQVQEFYKDATTTFSHPEEIPLEILRKQYGIGTTKKIVLLIGQVATDAAVVMDSPLYPDQVDFMLDVVDIMKEYADTHHLVIRLHPKEATGKTHSGKKFDNVTLGRIREIGLMDHDYVSVIHSSEINTYQLMDAADFGMTITSQAGLEMLIRYKRLLVVGDAFFSRKGFTWDVSNKCQLTSTVRDILNSDGLNDLQKENIDNFLYSLFFEYLYPKDLAGSNKRIRELFC